MSGWNRVWTLGLAALALGAWGCGDDTTAPIDPGPIFGIDAGTGFPVDWPGELWEDNCGAPGAPSEGDPCDNDNDCDNGCFCDGLEECVGGTCARAESDDPCARTTPPPEGSVACDMPVCFEELDSCFQQPLNDLCSNGEACDGFEVCDTNSFLCTGGIRLACNDENSCTVDSCNDDVGCVFTRRDLDGDGFLDTRCGGEDCVDNPANNGETIYPGAPEVCTNRRDDNCDGIRDYVDETCIPTNDTCETGQVLPGPGTYSASTKGLVGDYQVSCGRPGVDAVFHFTVPAGLFPDADVDAVDVTFQVAGTTPAALALRPRASCDGAADVDDKCTGGARLLRRSLPPGEYSAIVRTTGPVTSFDVRLAFDPPTEPPMVDVCTDMTDEITAGGTYTGFWEEVSDNYMTSTRCSFRPFSAVRDAVYKLVLTEETDVTITGSSTGPSTDYLFISMATDCADTSRHFACNYNWSSTTFTKRNTPPGTYFVILEPYYTTSEAWTISVDLEPSAERLVGDACVSAVDITESSRTVSFTSDFIDDDLVSCASTSKDAVFKFTLTESQDVTVSTDVSSITYPTWQYNYSALLSDCGLFSTELNCQYASGTNTLRYRSMAPGTYFVAVADYFGYMNTATAAVTLSPPTPVPANDRCSGSLPEICNVSGGLFIDRTGTLVGFEDDVSGCFAGRDAFYQCTLTERSDVLVNATASLASSTYSGIYLQQRSGATCAGSTLSGSCVSQFGSSGSLSTTLNRRLDAGTYWFVVERDTDPSGIEDFSLLAVTTPAP